MMSTTGRWSLEFQLEAGCHRYFRDLRTYRVAIADQSGATPDSTDDGILYLDTSKPVKLHATTLSSAIIPLLKPDGKVTATIASNREAREFARRYGMEIVDCDWS